MKYIFVALLLLTTLAIAQLPSDLIQTGPYSPVIDLRGTTPESAKAIDATNSELGLRTDWEIPNIGRYVSWKVTETQEDNIGVPTALLNFSGQLPTNLSETSVKVDSGANITVISSNSTGMIWT